MSKKNTTSASGHVWPGVLLALLATALYLSTMSPVAVPGDSARLIVEQAGLDAFPALAHPLYGWIARMSVDVPFGTLAGRLNALSALLAGCAVWLTYTLVRRIPHNRTFEETIARFNAATVQTFSALVSGAYLAVSMPFWICATRAHVAPLHLCILLGSIGLLMAYDGTGKREKLYLACLLYAIGATDFASMLLGLPVFAAYAVLAMYRRGELSLRTAGLAALSGFAGLLPYGLGAWHYMQLDAYAWREFKGFWHAIYFLLFDQYSLIVRGIPRLGWLTVAMVSVLPWLSVVGFRINRHAEPARGAWMGTYLLNSFLLLLSGLILFNGLVSPWHLTAMRPLLVTPYVIIAVWTGYVAGYWLIILIRRSQADKQDIPLPWNRRAMTAAFVTLLGGAVAWAAVRNAPTANARSTIPVYRVAERVSESLGARDILVSSSPMDELFIIASHQAGRPIRLINHQRATTASYLDYVASLFPNNERLQGLAQVGLTPVMVEWLREDPAARTRLAVMNTPDLWYAAGLQPLPDGFSFTGLERGTHPDLPVYWSAQQSFWSALDPWIKKDGLERESPILPWINLTRRITGKVANNTGVFLEEQGWTNEATMAYLKARELDPSNVSALMNLYLLAKRKELPEQKTYEEELTRILSRNRFEYWALAYHYGYVRSPEAYLQRGWTWALSGKSNLAAEEMQNAMQFGTNTAPVRVAMAGLLMDDDPAQAEATLMTALKEQPSNQKALLGLTRVSVRKGDFDSARQYVGRLRELGANEQALAVEEAMIDALTGKPEVAIARLKTALKKTPRNQRILTFLALVAGQVNDQQTVESCLSQLKTGKEASPALLLTLAQLSLQRQEWAQARKHFERYLGFRPGDTGILENLIQLDRVLGDRVAAQRHVDILISIDSRNAMANFMLGVLQHARGEYALAEASLRTSLSVKRLPDALNELAWLLARRGRAAEAEPLARECLTLNVRHAQAWDTLGFTLLELGRPDEAQKALEEALKLSPEDLMVRLHIVQVLERRGLKDEALKMADELLTRPGALDPADYEALRETALRLRRSKG